MPLNKRLKQRSENKAEKRSFHELPNKENENQGLLDLILILILLFCRNYNDPDQAILFIPRVVFSPFVKKNCKISRSLWTNSVIRQRLCEPIVILDQHCLGQLQSLSKTVWANSILWSRLCGPIAFFDQDCVEQ